MQYTSFTNADTLVSGGRAIVHGFAIRASAGAVVNIHDSSDTSGVPVFTLAIATGATELYDSAKGVPFNAGIYIKVLSGTAVGTIFWE